MRTSKRSSTANTNSISASESRPSWSSVACGCDRAGVDVELLDQHGGDGGEGRRLHADRRGVRGRRVHLMSRPAAASATRQNRTRPRPPARTVPQTSLELGFADPAAAPLAERLRPKTLDEVIGQRHLLGPGKPLRVAFESGRLHSMILWGPPGVGKTTLARLMADAFDAQFIAMSAVLGGVKDIREAVERAQAARTHGPARPSSSSTRCIASTRASRTRSCRTSSRASSPSSARPPRTRRSRSTRRCCRAPRCTC